MTTETGALLDMQALMAAAQQATGLEDFGDTEFVQWGEKWLHAAGTEGRVGEAGRAGLEQLITGWLVNRLRMADDIKKHPEILDEVVRSPIVVTGMPRTGTTKVQRVIASDPGLQFLPFWRVLNIAPMPEENPSPPTPTDPRITLAAGYIEQLSQVNPDFLVGHPSTVEEPEEELFIIEQDFRSIGNFSRVRVPSYFDEIAENPGFESHPFLKRCLQYIQWQQGPEGQRPWVIKTPSHLGNVDKLLAVFPDATVVHTYRDPVVTLGSLCRIMELFRSLAEEDIDLEEHGRMQMDAWWRMCRRHLELREDAEIDARVVDAHYDDIKDDIIGLVRRIYERAGREFDSTVEEAIRNWEAEHPQYKSGRFEYSLERYGLSEDHIKSVFADYIDRFDRVSIS